MQFSRAPIGVNCEPTVIYEVCHQMHMHARERVVTINHAEVTGNTAVILCSLSDITLASMNCYQGYQLKKGSE